MINAAEAYLNNRINTASKVDLTLMLYDGIIRFSNMAISAIEEKDIQKTNLNIQKAQAIIFELRNTLDFNIDLSHQLESLYVFVNGKLSDANIKKDIAPLNEALELIRDLRDTWREVMKNTKSQ